MRWSGGLNIRAENIDISDLEKSAARDYYEVKGQSFLTAMGVDLTRTTVDNRFRPTTGTRSEFAVEQFGALGGDYDFTKLSAEHYLFFPILEDDFGRKTVVSLSLKTGWIPQEGDAPVFERYYLGGRSFRGFEFRGIGPVGINNNTGEPGSDHVGGDFLAFAGIEVNRPIYQDMIAVVGFVDSGTITEGVSLDDYRVSIGTGLRIFLPQLGQAPLAFDIAYPLVKVDTDDTTWFSFSIDLPF